MSDTVLVTGANGFVGASVLAALSGRGKRGIGLVRRGRPGAVGVELREVDAWNETTLEMALRGCTSVVHAASVVHRPDASSEEYEKFNVQGTQALVRAAVASGVESLVFLSTVKVYGETPPAFVDEETPVQPDTGYSHTKIAAESIVREASGLRTAILRLAPVFGRGDKGNVRTVIRAINRRRFALPGEGETRKSLVHISTVAEVVAALLDKHAAGTFIVADREAPTMRALADAASNALGRRRPLAIPAPIILALAHALETSARWVAKKPPVTRELIRKSLTSTVFSPARVERECGITCHVDLTAAIQDEVAWLRDSRRL